MLHYNTVNDLLRNSLVTLMNSEEFSPFHFSWRDCTKSSVRTPLIGGY